MEADIQLTNVSFNLEKGGTRFGGNEKSISFFELLCNDFLSDPKCKQGGTCICQWCRALNNLENNVTGYASIIKQVFDNRQTILHCAARCVSPRKGLRVSVKILSICRKFGIEVEYLYTFVNAVDDKGFTALRIAAERKQKDMITILLRNYADINLLDDESRSKAVSLISNQVQREIVHLFDSHVQIIPDDLDPYNEDMWEIKCDFGPVIGSFKNFDEIHHQTKNLATWLRRGSTQKVANILLHPLMQIFLHMKGERYKILRFVSIIYHVVFYMFWATLAQCGAHVTNRHLLQDRKDNLDEMMDTDADFLEFRKLELVLNTTSTEWRQDFCKGEVKALIIPTFVLLLVNVLKELFMYFLSDKRLFYWRRWQNIFQWILYLPVISIILKKYCFHSITSDFETLFFIVSIFIAMALVQDQLSKFEILGLYSQIFSSGLKNVVRIGIAFLPFLTAFSVTFSLLLPLNDEFQLFGFSKIATMIVGELNHDAVFFPVGKPYKTVYYPTMTKLWFFIFAVAITMLFQNLVIASTISDGQKMKSEARAKFLAQRFDDIYLIENVIMHPLTLKLIELVGWKRCLIGTLNVTRNDIHSSSHKVKRLDEYPRKLQKVIVEWQEKCRQGPYQSTKL